MTETGYTMTAETGDTYVEAVARTREALAEQGFGVLCEIDVAATLEDKLGVESEPYLILGACNPQLAHRALTAEAELGVLLPCNVIVYRRDGRVHIAAVDPQRMLSIVPNEALPEVAGEVRRRLAAVVERAVSPVPAALG
jgi:uncharacterized protein (DUF302 family)